MKGRSQMNTMTDTLTLSGTGQLPARPITILVAALSGNVVERLSGV